MKTNCYGLITSSLLILGTGLIFLALMYGQIRETPFAVPEVAAQEITYLDFTSGSEVGVLDELTSRVSKNNLSIVNQTNLVVNELALIVLNQQIRQEMAKTAPELLLDASDPELKTLNLQFFDQDSFVKEINGGVDYLTRGGMMRKNGQRYVNLAAGEFIEKWETKFEENSIQNEVILGNGQELLTMILIHELIHFNTDFEKCARDEAEALAHQYDALWANKLKPILFKM